MYNQAKFLFLHQDLLYRIEILPGVSHSMFYVAMTFFGITLKSLDVLEKMSGRFM